MKFVDWSVNRSCAHRWIVQTYHTENQWRPKQSAAPQHALRLSSETDVRHLRLIWLLNASHVFGVVHCGGLALCCAVLCAVCVDHFRTQKPGASPSRLVAASNDEKITEEMRNKFKGVTRAAYVDQVTVPRTVCTAV